MATEFISYVLKFSIALLYFPSIYFFYNKVYAVVPPIVLEMFTERIWNLKIKTYVNTFKTWTGTNMKRYELNMWKTQIKVFSLKSLFDIEYIGRRGFSGVIRKLWKVSSILLLLSNLK